MEKEGYSFVIIECGVNDVSNAPSKNPEEVLETKVAALKDIILDMKKPGMQIVLVKPEQRTDSDRRKDLDHWFGRRLEEIFKKVSGVTIENLGVKARNKRKKAMLFGSHDGIHLARETGAYWATHQATLLVQ